jgi:Na+-driven multidrug efflux pump
MLGNVVHEISFGAKTICSRRRPPRFAMITMIIGGIVNIIMDTYFCQNGLGHGRCGLGNGYRLQRFGVLGSFLLFKRLKSVVKLSLATLNSIAAW